MDTLRQDIRFALRAMTRSRGTALVAIATLAIGIAVVTTIFSFVNTALFRPVPYPDADRLVALSAEPQRGASAGFSQLALRSVQEIRRSAHAFEQVAAFREMWVTLSGEGEAARLHATAVDPELLPMLGAHARLGRVLTSVEIREQAPLVLLSDRLWRARFGARDDIVGHVVRIAGTPYTVLGVMPEGFRFYERSDLWLPLVEREDSTGSVADPTYSMIGRLRRGVSLERARSEMHLIGQQLAAAEPELFGAWRLVVRDGMVDRGPRAWGPFAILLLGAATCVLLVACSNVASLFLARATERRGEMAIRASLGASRSRLVRQSLTESVLLALIAGAIGAVLSSWGIRLITGLVPLAEVPSWVRFGVDARVLAFTCILSLVTVVGVGVLPALEGTRVDLMHTLRGDGASMTTGRGAARRGRIVIVAELALSLVLFIGAALITRTYHRLATMDPGFQPERVLSTSVALDPARYPDGAQRRAFYHDVAARIGMHPGVEGTAVVGTFRELVSGARQTERGSTPADRDQSPRDQRLFLPSDPASPAARGLYPAPGYHVISDDYFRVLGLRLRAGRGFDMSDRDGSPPVVVLSERMARHLWKGENPIGQMLRIGQTGPLLTVIGVVSDVRTPTFGIRGLGTDPHPDLYLSERQATSASATLLVRARTDARALESSVTAAVRALDPEQAVVSVGTLAEEIALTTSVIRVLALIFAAFAGCALVLALIGIYGVISYSVAQRTRELGIRMALGATTPDVLRTVLRRGVQLTAVGLAIGLVAAVLLSRAMSGALRGLAPVSVATYAAATITFAAVALLAAYLPARRAARVDPMVALRER